MVLTVEEQEEKLAALEVLAIIADVPVNVREFHSDWILFTYDLPNTPEGVKARYNFLGKAKYLGAMQHTESVYFMPWTDAANAAALDLADAGTVYVWHTKVGEVNSIDLTKDYDAKIINEIKALDVRVDKIVQHAKDKHEQQVRRMAEKTWTMINSLSKAVVSRGNEEVAQKLYDVISALKYAESLAEV